MPPGQRPIKNNLWEDVKKAAAAKLANTASNQSGKGYSMAGTGTGVSVNPTAGVPKPSVSSNESGLGYSMAGTGSGVSVNPAAINNPYKVTPAMINAQAAPSGNVGAGGAVGGMGAAAPVAPVVSNPTGIDLEKLYGDTGNRVKGYGDAVVGAFDPALNKIRDYYATANNDMYAQYMNSRASADASAAGLGVDPNAFNAGWDQSNRRIEENSNQSMADSEAFFTKMKGAREAYTTEMMMQLEAQKLAAQQEQSLAILDYMASQATGGGGSGGGGGRRSGGSSSSGNPITETATMTEELRNTYDTEIYNDILRSNGPVAAEQYRLAALEATGDDTTQLLAKQYNMAVQNKPTTVKANQSKAPGWIGKTLTNAYTGKANQVNTANNAKYNATLKQLSAILNASAAKGSGVMGAATGKAKVATVGKQKTK